MRTKSFLLPLAIAAAAATSPAMAQYNQGSILVRVGAAYVEPEENTFSLVESFLADDPTTGTSDAPVNENVPVDIFSDLSLDDDVAWFVSVAWMAADHWGLELYHAHDAELEASVSTDVYAEGVLIDGMAGTVGDFDTNTTSFFVNWYPLDATCMIQPYVGLGVSYVDIEQDFLRPVYTDGVDDFGLINLGSDFGWTAQVGVDFNFGHESAWQVNVSAMYVDASPDLEFGYDQRAAVPGFGSPDFLPVRIRRDMDIDPWIFNLGVGYKFSF